MYPRNMSSDGIQAFGSIQDDPNFTFQENPMKHLKRFATVAVFVLTLTTASFAGQISTGITSPPPPPQNSIEQADANNVGGEVTTDAQASDSVVEVALSLVESLLALF